MASFGGCNRQHDYKTIQRFHWLFLSIVQARSRRSLNTMSDKAHEPVANNANARERDCSAKAIKPLCERYRVSFTSESTFNRSTGSRDRWQPAKSDELRPMAGVTRLDHPRIGSREPQFEQFYQSIDPSAMKSPVFH